MTKVVMNANPDRKLNCIGLFCPEPVIKTREELDKMKANETLEVLADDPAAEADIRSLVKHLQHEVLSVGKEGNAIRILIKKTERNRQEV
jgi:tRNA 2-thiouridine synthesizing protein A